MAAAYEPPFNSKTSFSVSMIPGPSSSSSAASPTISTSASYKTAPLYRTPSAASASTSSYSYTNPNGRSSPHSSVHTLQPPPQNDFIQPPPSTSSSSYLHKLTGRAMARKSSSPGLTNGSLPGRHPNQDVTPTGPPPPSNPPPPSHDDDDSSMPLSVDDDDKDQDDPDGDNTHRLPQPPTLSPAQQQYQHRRQRSSTDFLPATPNSVRAAIVVTSPSPPLPSPSFLQQQPPPSVSVSGGASQAAASYLHPQAYPPPNPILPSVSSPPQTSTTQSLLSPPVVPIPPGKPIRRNTTGSTPSLAASSSAKGSPEKGKGKKSGHQHHALHIRHHSKGTSQIQMPFDDSTVSTAILGEGGMDMASDIEIYAERIRKERQEKRARAAREREEAERKLTRREREGGEMEDEIVLVGSPQGRGGGDSRLRDREKEREKDQDIPLVGNLIGEDHVNYVLMYNMLTGIRIGVSRCQAKIKRPLTEEDFKGRHKFSFDIVGNELTPSAKYDFKFKDYAPWVFRYLREDIFALDPADYLLSLTAKYILSELGSPGKSGSFFYFSRDYRFIIKTIRHSEHKFLLSILGRYYEYVKANPHTLLSRFYGLHRVKLPRGRKIHFVIMNNLFPAHKDIHETYDLKGSTIGRLLPEQAIAKNPRAVMKDLNWIYRGNRLELGPEKRALLTEQLRRDEEFLKSVRVMDYSLLVGIHHLGRGNRENVRRNTLKVFSPNLPEPTRRSKLSQSGSKSPEAIAMRRAMRSSDPQRLTTGPLPPPPSQQQQQQQPVVASSSSSPNPNANYPSADHTAAVLISPQTQHFNQNQHLTQHPNQTHHEAQHFHFLPDEPDSADHRQQFLFYQDDGGLRATDDGNDPLGDVYYLGVIDILTPWGCVKRMEGVWKGMGAGGERHKISPVPPLEYGDRFFAFMKAIMRGGEGLDRFLVKGDRAKAREGEKEKENDGEEEREKERQNEKENGQEGQREREREKGSEREKMKMDGQENEKETVGGMSMSMNTS